MISIFYLKSKKAEKALFECDNLICTAATYARVRIAQGTRISIRVEVA